MEPGPVRYPGLVDGLAPCARGERGEGRRRTLAGCGYMAGVACVHLAVLFAAVLVASDARAAASLPYAVRGEAASRDPVFDAYVLICDALTLLAFAYGAWEATRPPPGCGWCVAGCRCAQRGPCASVWARAAREALRHARPPAVALLLSLLSALFRIYPVHLFFVVGSVRLVRGVAVARDASVLRWLSEEDARETVVHGDAYGDADDDRGDESAAVAEPGTEEPGSGASAV